MLLYRLIIENMKYLALIIFLSVSSILFAQEISSEAEKQELEKISYWKRHNAKFAPVPYINYDRTLEFTFGALPLVMYNLSEKDTISPQSITGGLLMYATNKSWFGMVFNRTYFNEDKYRATLAGGLGVTYYQFFMSEPFNLGYIDYNVDIVFLFAELQRKVIGNLYAGLNYKYAKLETVIPEFESQDGEIIPEMEETEVLNGLGAILSYDDRDDVYYPYNGLISNLKYSTFPGFMGNDLVSKKVDFDYNHFVAFRKKKDVLAARFFGGAGIGELSFNQQFVVGGEDVRGYSQGKYRGEQIIALQAEYRWNPYEKIGFVGFVGSAMVFNGMNSEDNGILLPSLGAGFRYTVFPDNHMNVGMDFAAGKDDWGIYFRIGESF